MEPVLKGVFDELENLHGEMYGLLQDLLPDALDWIPADGTNSLAVLATHVAGSQRYWVGELIMGEPSHRVRKEEFKTAQVGAAQLLRSLDEALELTRQGFERLTLDRLAEDVFPPWRDQPISVARAIAHVLQHTALHLGHMELTRQLMEPQEQI